ncbi:tetratricopeptide repeat protein [Ramlibacter sp.]|uniref:tetratricopeptide repeat protein n=1 Tax=Ramlibacter sp. TaxID=1917967 RepID=UPI002FC7DA11
MLHSSGSKSGRLAAAALLGGLAAAAAHAQVDPTGASRQAEDTFRQSMLQPQDTALLMKHARALAAEGNFEGGIAALERLLLEPNAHPALVLEVAQYYWRLGSYGMSEQLLQRALADARLTGDHRVAAERLLREVRKRNQVNRLAGNAVFGLRHQTNPAYRTYEAQVLSGGVLVAPAANQRPSSDWDMSLGVQARHEYDLDLQNSATIDSTLVAYLVDYHSASGSTLVANPGEPYDLGLLDATIGLRFKPSPGGAPKLTLRPHVALTYLAAQWHSYLRNAGVGLDVGYDPGDVTKLLLTVDSVKRDFADRIDVPTASTLDGRLTSLRLRGVHEWRPRHWMTGEYAHRRNSTGADFYDYDSDEVRVAYTVAYPSPVRGLGAWSSTLWAGYVQRGYDAADPAISAGTVRKDTERRIGLQQIVGFADQWSLVLALEHVRLGSNLPNFRIRNTSVFAGVSRAF